MQFNENKPTHITMKTREKFTDRNTIDTKEVEMAIRYIPLPKRLSLHEVSYLELSLETVINRQDQYNESVDECLTENPQYTRSASELDLITSLWKPFGHFKMVKVISQMLRGSLNTGENENLKELPQLKNHSWRITMTYDFKKHLQYNCLNSR